MDERAEQIGTLVAEYRERKAVIDELQAALKAVKNELEPLLVEHGKYEDDEGYAMIVTRSPSVSYKSAEVEKLTSAWLESADPVMQSCGTMLRMHRQEKPGSRYVRVS